MFANLPPQLILIVSLMVHDYLNPKNEEEAAMNHLSDRLLACGCNYVSFQLLHWM